MSQNADVEKVARDLLRAAVTAKSGAGSVGCTNDVPVGWTPSSKPHLSVFMDGGTTVWPVAQFATVRVVARAATNDAAKDLARWAEAVLLSHGGTVFPQVQPLLGVVPVKDQETGHQLAWFTVRVSVRTV